MDEEANECFIGYLFAREIGPKSTTYRVSSRTFDRKVIVLCSVVFRHPRTMVGPGHERSDRGKQIFIWAENRFRTEWHTYRETFITA